MLDYDASVFLIKEGIKKSEIVVFSMERALKGCFINYITQRALFPFYHQYSSDTM